MRVHFDDSGAISFSYLLMLYTTPVVSFSKKMNNVKKGLVMQEPIEFIAFWQRATTALYIENNIPRKEMKVDSTSFEEVMRILWAKSVEKENNS